MDLQPGDRVLIGDGAPDGWVGQWATIDACNHEHSHKYMDWYFCRLDDPPRLGQWMKVSWLTHNPALSLEALYRRKLDAIFRRQQGQ